jgi:hypothetical protein
MLIIEAFQLTGMEVLKTDGVNVRDSYKKVTSDDISHLCGKVGI